MENELSSDPKQRSGPNVKALAKIAAGGSLVAVFVIFAAQNAGSVDVEFLAWNFTIRLILLMVASAVAGVAVWQLAGFLWRRSHRSG